jgi:hypothetical protein
MPGVMAIAAPRETQVVVTLPTGEVREVIDRLASHLATEGPEMEVGSIIEVFQMIFLSCFVWFFLFFFSCRMCLLVELHFMTTRCCVCVCVSLPVCVCICLSHCVCHLFSPLAIVDST